MGLAPVLVTDRCQGCGACLLTCPEHAIRPHVDWEVSPQHAIRPPVDRLGSPLLVLADLCTGCLECIEVCPADAIDALDAAEEKP